MGPEAGNNPGQYVYEGENHIWLDITGQQVGDLPDVVIVHSGA